MQLLSCPIIKKSFTSLLILLSLTGAHALEVTGGSVCGPACIDDISENPNFSSSSHTISGDLVCDDWELDGPNSTVRGRKWKDCQGCLSTSTAQNEADKENDVYWFLCRFLDVSVCFKPKSNCYFVMFS